MSQYQGKDVATECPICDTPINQQLSRCETPASNCGSKECLQELRRISQNERKTRSRDRMREQRILEEEALDQRIRDYAKTLQPQYAELLLSIFEKYGKYGRKLAASIIEMIEAERRETEAQRCKHDNISTIVDVYNRCLQRVEGVDRHNTELRARVQELEQEVQFYQSFERKVMGHVAQEELRKQPDPVVTSLPSSLSAPGAQK